jgi:hypothetical protein
MDDLDGGYVELREAVLSGHQDATLVLFTDDEGCYESAILSGWKAYRKPEDVSDVLGLLRPAGGSGGSG